MEVCVENLSKHFHDGDKVIDIFRDLSFSVNSGESLAITGESGVGKTTLLYILGGLDQPTSGKVKLGDFCISDISPEDRRLSKIRGEHIGFVFQFHYLLPEFSALENVMMPLRLQRWPNAKALNRAEELLLRVGLKERMSHRPGTLSGGEQQRVAVARALAANPGLILADEPTGNLDQKTGEAIVELLLDVHREFETTLIIVTHSKDVARKMHTERSLTSSGFTELRDR